MGKPSFWCTYKWPFLICSGCFAVTRNTNYNIRIHIQSKYRCLYTFSYIDPLHSWFVSEGTKLSPKQNGIIECYCILLSCNECRKKVNWKSIWTEWVIVTYERSYLKTRARQSQQNWKASVHLQYLRFLDKSSYTAVKFLFV